MYAIEYTGEKPSWGTVKRVVQEQEPHKVITQGPGDVIVVSYSPEEEAAMNETWRRKRQALVDSARLGIEVGQ